MSPIRIGMIGVGHLGQIHARLLRQVAGAELVGIVDTSAAARKGISDELGVPAYADHGPLLGKIDAAVVATGVGERFLETLACEATARAIEAGASAFVCKGTGDLLSTIKRLCDGR